jgi:hypothetical protein
MQAYAKIDIGFFHLEVSLQCWTHFSLLQTKTNQFLQFTRILPTVLTTACTQSFYFCPVVIFSLQQLLSVFRGYWPFLRRGGIHVRDDFTGYCVCIIVAVSRIGVEYLCKGIPFLWYIRHSFVMMCILWQIVWCLDYVLSNILIHN